MKRQHRRWQVCRTDTPRNSSGCCLPKSICVSVCVWWIGEASAASRESRTSHIFYRLKSLPPFFVTSLKFHLAAISQVYDVVGFIFNFGRSLQCHRLFAGCDYSPVDCVCTRHQRTYRRACQVTGKAHESTDSFVIVRCSLLRCV